MTSFRNRIINGNAMEEIKKIPENSVDLIFADPPYWMRVEGVLTRVEGSEFDGCDDPWDQFSSLEDYEEFTRAWLSACHRVLKPSGTLWVIGSMQCIYSVGSLMQRMGYWLINDVIWHKKNPTPNFLGTRLNNSHETLIWAAKSKKSRFTFHYKTAKELNVEAVTGDEYARGIRKQMGSVWRFPVCSGRERLKDEAGQKLHSTQKPLQLLERIIAISSNRGDLVLDPFAGTMTTAAAAKKLGRDYLMIEKEAKYCHYGEARLAKIEWEDSAVAEAKYDEKPVRVTLAEMIEARALVADEDFYFKTGEAIARLLESGKLAYHGEILDIHTCAARARGGKAGRLNGYNYWYVMRDGERVPISRIRIDFRKKTKKEQMENLREE